MSVAEGYVLFTLVNIKFQNSVSLISVLTVSSELWCKNRSDAVYSLCSNCQPVDAKCLFKIVFVLVCVCCMCVLYISTCVDTVEVE